MKLAVIAMNVITWKEEKQYTADICFLLSKITTNLLCLTYENFTYCKFFAK